MHTTQKEKQACLAARKAHLCKRRTLLAEARARLQAMCVPPAGLRPILEDKIHALRLEQEQVALRLQQYVSLLTSVPARNWRKGFCPCIKWCLATVTTGRRPWLAGTTCIAATPPGLYAHSRSLDCIT